MNQTAGVGATLEFVGPELFLGSEGFPAARHERHQWRVQRDSYTALRVSGWLCVRFENDPAAYGPFTGLRFIDGVMQTDDGHVLAIYSETEAVWELTAEDRACARVKVEDVDAVAASIAHYVHPENG